MIKHFPNNVVIETQLLVPRNWYFLGEKIYFTAFMKTLEIVEISFDGQEIWFEETKNANY